MAAADEFATVFLEVSLGTRLVVSFPASSTTVADLKRQVTAEHAACFPQTGPIAVDSMQVKLDGSFFHLTDSMAVKGAFRWVQGPWHILVEARELRSHIPARKNADCASSDDSEQNSGNPVSSHSTQNMPPALSQGGDNLAIGANASDTPLLNQLHTPHQDVKHASDQIEDENTVPHVGKPHQDVEHASDQVEDDNTVTYENSDPYLAAGGTDALLMVQQDQSHEGAKKHASVQPEYGNVNTLPQESFDINLLAGGSVPREKNQLDKSYGSVNPAFGQCEDSHVKTMPEESTDFVVVTSESEDFDVVTSESEDFDVVTSESEASQMNQLDKPHEDVRDSEQLEDGIVNVMPQKSSDVDESAAKDNDPMQGQQKDVIAEPRGMELFEKENKNDESIIQNCDGNISSIASSNININLAGEKISRTETEQGNLKSNPLEYNQGNCSYEMGKKPSHDQKGPWTSEVCYGESSNSVSDIPPSMGRDISSNTEVDVCRSDAEEPRVAGMCSVESSFKETDVPHCIKSMEEGNRRPDSNDRFVKKRNFEDTTASTSAEHKSCFKTRQQKFLCMRKMPIRKAAKKYGFRCEMDLSE